jgi:hypothetical protein
MDASVATVSEQVMLGRTVGEVASRKGYYEKIIYDVFDRVLSGYTVQQVSIIPGVQTRVNVEIKPWGPVVRRVVLHVDLPGMDPAVAAMVKQDMGDIAGKLNDELLGLPVDAVDWAGGLSKLMVRDWLNEQLPEFRASMDITGGTCIQVHLILSPVGPIVQDTAISLRSKSIPNILLAEVKPAVEDTAKMLNGLPVAYVERHRSYFEQRLTVAIARQPVARSFQLTVNSAIEPGEDTGIRVNAETHKYNIWLESYLDMGRRENDTSFLLHAGQFFRNRDEAFVELQFIPASVSWEFMPGWGHRIGNSLEAGVKVDTSAKQAIYWMNQQLNRNWMLRVERWPVNGHDEIGLRYKLDDYLSMEYVFTQNNKWLRLVGSL